MTSLLRLSVALGLALVGTAVVSSQEPASSDRVQVVEVTAKKYVFDPSPIHVKKGARVQLKITATDHAHGVEIDLYPERVAKIGPTGLEFTKSEKCHKIDKGETGSIEFVARTEGTYHFKCCTECGFHHRSMKGELIVDP